MQSVYNQIIIQLMFLHCTYEHDISLGGHQKTPGKEKGDT
jgi:hypothetical protein